MFFSLFSSFKKYRVAWISSIVLVLFVLSLLSALWARSLFAQLELVSSRRAMQRPARFYTDITLLAPGMPLSAGGLVERLQLRGYGPAEGSPDEEGLYYLPDEGSCEVYFRSFVFPDGRGVSGLHRFVFSGGRLKRIARTGGTVLSELPLEPVLLGDFSGDGVENRPWITLDTVPAALKDGVVASEDRRFFSHRGLDPVSLARAFVTDVKRKGIYQGGSTITQQLVKNAFLSRERTLRRKLTEAFLSVLMEIRYSKEEILEMYLNQIYLGENGTRGVYGVEDASTAYFGKHVPELSPGESALLVGLIPAPNAFSPRHYPDRALKRRDRVLDLLERQGKITGGDLLREKNAPLVLAPLSRQSTGDYYVTLVRELLERELGRAILDFQGYRIYTTMDLEMQKAAENAIKDSGPEGALVALEPGTGFVRALVGGRTFATSPYDRAVNARRSPGSAFKAIVYAAALESGQVTLATPVEDKPLKVMHNNAAWEPGNYSGVFSGTTTVRDAIVFSLNIPAVKVFTAIGAEKVIALARALGIQSELLPVPSLALGTSEVTPLEMTAAYAAFANGGYAVKPVFIRWVTDGDGKVIKEYGPVKRQALSPETASLITSALEDAVQRGTGSNVRKLGYTGPAAGKTGTSEGYKDAWFIGYTPELVCGVWLGYDLPRSLGKSASSLAVPLWVRFMSAVQDNPSPRAFVPSRSLAKVTIDPASGLRARSGCTDRRSEFFIRGTEPKKYCALHPGGLPGFFNRLFSRPKK